MAINDFQFPGVELTQEFVETPVTGVSQLGVAVIGYQNKVNTTSWIYDGTNATKITLSKVPYCTADETYTLTVTADAPITTFDTANGDSLAISGSTIASDNLSAVVVFDASVTAGTAATAAFGDELPVVGDPVAITGTSATSGVIKAISGATVTVGIDGVPLTGASVSAVAFKKTSAKVTITNATVAAEGEDAVLTLPAVVAATVPSGASTKAVTLQTSNSAIPLYIEYTPKTLALTGVGSLTDIIGTFGNLTGPVSNALAFALLAASGNIVYYLCTTADATLAYERALDYLDRYNNIYSIVPAVSVSATANQEIVKACIAAVERISADTESKVYRTVWYGIEGTDAASVVATRQSIGTSYRAQAVWSDTPYYNGAQVKNFALAAAAAGMRCYEPAYRPISNLGYNFFSLKETNGFTATDLKYMGSNGIWIIANNYDGTPINMRQITTAVSNNLNKDEESIVANADSIALTLCRVGENLVGCSNISPDLLVALHDTLTGILDRYLLNLTGNVYVGPQLLSYSIDRLEQDPVQLDHIYATITCEPPKPFNRFVMTLRIV